MIYMYSRQTRQLTSAKKCCQIKILPRKSVVFEVNRFLGMVVAVGAVSDVVA